MLLRIIVLWLALSSVAQICAAQGQTEIYQAGGESAEAGFVDVSLRIESMNCESWTSCSVQAAGVFRGRPVAVEVLIQSMNGQGKISYRSVGPRSDELLAALATLYKLPRKKVTFARAASADIIFLEARPEKMAAKVFFAANGLPSSYAELYTNIDRRRRVLEIFEKDPEYRANVLKGLSQ
jgi:hypothetical protein